MTQTQALTWAPIKEAGRQRQRPAGRSGHTITAMGPNVYIFGGLVEDASPAGPTDQLWLLTMSSTDAEWQVCPKKVRDMYLRVYILCTRSLLRDTAKTFFHSLQILRFGSNMYTYVLVILRIMYGKLSITCYRSRGLICKSPCSTFPFSGGCEREGGCLALRSMETHGDLHWREQARSSLRGVICVMYGQHDCRMHLRLAPRIDRNAANSIMHNVLIQATCEAALFDWLISMLNIIPLTLLVHF